MKILKYVGLFLLALVVLYLLACLIGPKNFNIVATKKIDAPAPIIFNLVNNLEKNELWNPWSMQDSTMVTTYSGKAEGVGAKSEWTSESQGEGKQEIIESIQNERVKSTLEFKGWDGTNFSTWAFKSNGNSTEVSWDFEGTPIPFLMRGMLLTAKKVMRKSYKEGLENISKLAVERKNNLYTGFEIKDVDSGIKHFVMNRQEVALDNIQQFYANNLGSLFGKVTGSGVELAGMPCGLFFRLEPIEGKIDMAAAIPTKEEVNLAGVQTLTIDPKNALAIDFYGDYHGISTAHKAMEEFMKDRSMLKDVPIIEEYITDPGAEPDPAKWLTRVTYYYTQTE